ncbi:unnamed protein product [Arabis nemorensis]|uniref:Uncharacterized protein n=1 Tax=Arabis nemorensis TaxID=586526 RepID=A0A565BJH9_9BRAS|nr:unnamed protein product [Arabis nemorensis]
MSQTQQRRRVLAGHSHSVLPPGAIGRTLSRSSANCTTRHSLNVLLDAPARRDQPHLHPPKLDGALCAHYRDHEPTESVYASLLSNLDMDMQRCETLQPTRLSTNPSTTIGSVSTAATPTSTRPNASPTASE